MSLRGFWGVSSFDCNGEADEVPNELDLAADEFVKILEKYQELPQLLDRYLQGIVMPLLSQARAANTLARHTLFRLL